MPPTLTPAPGSAINTTQDGAAAGSIYRITTAQRITSRPVPADVTFAPAPSVPRGTVTDSFKVLDLLGAATSLGASFSFVDFNVANEAESPGVHTVGSQLLGPARDVGFEDCRWAGSGICFSAVADASGRPFAPVWNRCHFRHAAEVLLQLTNVDQARVMECLFDHAGYGSNPGHLSMDRLHCLYANSDVVDLEVWSSLFTRARNGAIRCGGRKCSASMVVDAGTGIVLHSGSRQCSANLVSMVHHPGTNPDGTFSRTGGGIRASAANSCTINGNTLTFAGPATKGQELYAIGLSDDKDRNGTTNCTLSGNRIYDWASAGDDGVFRGCCLGIGDTSGAGCTVTNEVYQQVRGGALIEVQGDPRRITWGRNTYFSMDPKPFFGNGRWMNFAEWQAASGDTNSVWKRTDLRLPTPSEVCRAVLGTAGTDPAKEIADACAADWGRFARVRDTMKGTMTGARG